MVVFVACLTHLGVLECFLRFVCGVAPSLRPEGRRRGIDCVLRSSFTLRLSVNMLEKIFINISRFPFTC